MASRMLRRGSSSELTTGQIHIWRTSSMHKEPATSAAEQGNHHSPQW